jgi:hypothetical protein
MATNHSSCHPFNSNHDTHLKKVATLTTYSWDVENTYDLINP